MVHWGGWHYVGGNGMRVGYVDYIVASEYPVQHNASNVTIKADIYTENQYQYADPQHLSYSGAIDGRYDYYNGSSGGAVYRDTISYTWSYTDYGVGHYVETFVEVLGTYNGSSPSVVVGFSIPPRPIAAPAEPPDLFVDDWTDSMVTMQWTNAATEGEPYDSIYFQYAYWSEDTEELLYYFDLGTVSGSTTIATFGGLFPDNQFYVRCRAQNSAGVSGWTYITDGPYPTTTPEAPTDVTASISTDGQSIELTWTDQSNVPHLPLGPDSSVYNPNNYQIQKRTSPGAAWVFEAGNIPDDATSYIDTNPADGYNEYRVRLVVPDTYAGNVPELPSDWSYSNTISTIVPPLAPTNLHPDGEWIDLNLDQTLTWDYHDGGDGSEQSHFQIRYRRVSSSTWTTTAQIESSQQQYVLPGGTLQNSGEAYEWQVRTQGSTQAGYGPWSNSAILKGTATPTVTIQSGTPPDPLTQLPPRADWFYNQAQGAELARWEAQLLDSSGRLLAIQGDTDDSAFDPNQGEWHVRFPNSTVEDGQTYTIRIRATSIRGLTSDWAVASFTVNLLPPAPVTMTLEYDDPSGSMILSLVASSNNPGTTAEVASVEVQRRILTNPATGQLSPVGGWVSIYTDISLDAGVEVNVIDTLPSLYGVNQYRLIVTSTSPSKEIQDPVQYEVRNYTGRAWFFVNYGSGFTNVLRFQGNPSTSENVGRSGSTVELLGRKWPVLQQGQQRTKTVDVSGALQYETQTLDGPDPSFRLEKDHQSSTPNEWREAAKESTVVCYRDPYGRRVFGAMTDMAIDDQRIGIASISFTVTRIDYEETPSVVVE